MTYRIQVLPSATRELAGLDTQTRRRIDKRIQLLSETPRPSGMKALQGEKGLFRIRVGDYRVIYTVRDEVLLVIVVKVGHRREVYR